MSDLREALQQSVAAGNVSYTLSREAEAAKLLLSSLEAVIGDDEEAKAGTIEGETNFNEAMQAAVDRIAYCTELVAGIEARQERLAARKTRIDQQGERIRASLLRAMETLDLTKFECSQATLSLRKVPPKAIITNDVLLPTMYLVEKTTITPDKKAILDALKGGVNVPGAELSNGARTIAIKFS